MSETVTLSPRRRLTDLYVRGTEVSITDGFEEDPIVVWVSKISPLEQKDAADRAAAARATVLAIKHFDDDHEDKIPYFDQLDQLGEDSRESLIEYLIAPKVQERMVSHEEQLASEDKWAKDGYYESLRESWTSEMESKYEDNPKDPAAKRVFTELKKFVDEVDRRVEADKIDLVASYDIKPDKEIRKEVINRLIESEGDFAWLAEFRKWQLFYSVREPEEHKRRYFISKEEVDALDPRVMRVLVDAFLGVSVDAIEGKG